MEDVTVVSAAKFAAAILIESGLSFLGIDAQPPRLLRRASLRSIIRISSYVMLSLL
ncbi:MAG: hypothetical protein ACMUEM_00250 [Flavobacteriales bacterium AspAUS03]